MPRTYNKRCINVVFAALNVVAFAEVICESGSKLFGIIHQHVPRGGGGGGRGKGGLERGSYNFPQPGRNAACLGILLGNLGSILVYHQSN